jgi:hypothetical protein
MCGSVGKVAVRARGRSMRNSFLSGGTALLFVTLWLRLIELTFGNSIWAAAPILSSFMVGPALGTGFGSLTKSPFVEWLWGKLQAEFGFRPSNKAKGVTGYDRTFCLPGDYVELGAPNATNYRGE